MDVRRADVTAPECGPSEPRHIREAPSHADPYPYYARLLGDQRVLRDDVNGCWVVVRADAVREVLTSALCRTRPADEPVPHALRGGAMEELFGRLVRLTDGDRHTRMKIAVVTAVHALDFTEVAELARVRARELDREIRPIDTPEKITQFAFALPVQVLALLLGVERARFPELMSWLSAYGAAATTAVAGLPLDDASAAAGHDAARGLLALIDTVVRDGTAGPLMRRLIAEAERLGCVREDIAANGVGLMIQGYASLASVIGLTVLALARDAELLARARTDRSLVAAIVQEALRHDTSTSSTIRFVAEDGVVAGQRMAAGDAIIVVIGAANRDPAFNPHPERFDALRSDRRCLEFGAGVHACPADMLAPFLVERGVEHLLASGAPIAGLDRVVQYAASAHVRIPRFVTVGRTA